MAKRKGWGAKKNVELLHGICLAAGWLLRAHGEDSLAEEMLRDCGVKYKDVKGVIDEYDFEVVGPLLLKAEKNEIRKAKHYERIAILNAQGEDT